MACSDDNTETREEIRGKTNQTVDRSAAGGDAVVHATLAMRSLPNADE